MQRLTDILTHNSQYLLLTAGGVFGVVQILGWRLRTRCFPHLYQISGETITSFDDALMHMLCNLGPWFYGVSGLWIVSQLITLPQFLTQTVTILFLIVVIGQLGTGLIQVVLQLIREQWFDDRITQNYTLLSVIIKIILWTIIALLILTNLNIEITPLLASLGVVGIAVSFALQSILEDLFASVSIYLDKPFRIGDYITVGDEGGVVEHVGVKTTRIRTILGEELVVANRKLTESIIHNYGKIQERTISHEIVVGFNTSPQLQTHIPNLVKQSMDFTDLIDYQWCHLTGIGKRGLIYQRRYTLRSSDYATHLQTQEKVLMNVLQALDNEGVHLQKQGIS